MSNLIIHGLGPGIAKDQVRQEQIRRSVVPGRLREHAMARAGRIYRRFAVARKRGRRFQRWLSSSRANAA